MEICTLTNSMIKIIDSYIAPGKIHLTDTIADHVSSSRVVSAFSVSKEVAKTGCRMPERIDSVSSPPCGDAIERRLSIVFGTQATETSPRAVSLILEKATVR